MSVQLFSGTPGSGKSLHAVKLIRMYLRQGRNVIANFPVKIENIKGVTGNFTFIPDEELNVDYLVRYALKYHKKGKEGQTILVLDECQSLFNPREFARPDRMKWNRFFSMHRHLGFSCILISQADRLIDKQIRFMIEFEVRHRAANNFKTIGWLMTLLHIKFFVAIYEWYTAGHARDHVETFLYNKRYADLYDSYALFDINKANEIVSDKGRDGRRHVRGVGAPVVTPPGPAPVTESINLN
jgi:zona occludens toxin